MSKCHRKTRCVTVAESLFLKTFPQQTLDALPTNAAWWLKASNRSTELCVFHRATYKDVGMALNLNHLIVSAHPIYSFNDLKFALKHLKRSRCFDHMILLGEHTLFLAKVPWGWSYDRNVFERFKRFNVNFRSLNEYICISFLWFFIRAISKLYICIPTNCTQLIYFINNTLKHMYCLKL